MIVPANRLIWAAALIGVPLLGAAAIAPAVLAVAGICALIAVLDAVRGRERARDIELRTPPFLRLTKGVAGILPITIENRSGAPLAIRIGAVIPEGVESEREIEEVVAPEGASAIEWKCTGTARGDHSLPDLHLETPSPWGLWSVRGARKVDFVFRVYPNLRDRDTAALFLRAAPGARMRRQVGKGREFDNLRHYVSGDSFEDIHWKATARRGFPVVKQYRVEHAQEVYAAIDSSRLSAREGILESYVDAALHLALVAERQGDRFGLVTFSDRTHRFVRARGGLDHFRLCRETIYNLRAERVSPDFREVFTTLQLNLRRRSLIVFFTSLDDALLADTFEREVPLLARRHLVLVNVTRTGDMQPLFTGAPPEDLDAVYRGLAGQMLWNRMRALQIALGHHGVRLSLVEPGGMKRKVTAEYLEVKRRQAL
jgi:uncharacterized protein (DUF58 family)